MSTASIIETTDNRFFEVVGRTASHVEGVEVRARSFARKAGARTRLILPAHIRRVVREG